MSYNKRIPSKTWLNSLEEVSGFSIQSTSMEDLKNLFYEILNNGLHGLCYSLYEENQRPGDMISKDQVYRRMEVLKPYCQWVRSFSCTEGNEHVPSVAKEMGMNCLVGAWLESDLAVNKREIEGLIKLANEGRVDVAAVGNEVMYRNDLTEDQLLDYIEEVKNAIPKDIPVGYVDAYYEFTQRPRLVEACDILLANCYPFWEGCPLEYSLNHIHAMYQQVRQVAGYKKIIITETGWPSQGKNLGGAHPSPENALKYFIQTQLWALDNEIAMFYFSSFDESWKVDAEGDVGAYWGIWDKHGSLKY